MSDRDNEKARKARAAMSRIRYELRNFCEDARIIATLRRGAEENLPDMPPEVFARMRSVHRNALSVAGILLAKYDDVLAGLCNATGLVNGEESDAHVRTSEEDDHGVS